MTFTLKGTSISNLFTFVSALCVIANITGPTNKNDTVTNYAPFIKAAIKAIVAS